MLIPSLLLKAETALPKSKSRLAFTSLASTITGPKFVLMVADNGIEV